MKSKIRNDQIRLQTQHRRRLHLGGLLENQQLNELTTAIQNIAAAVENNHVEVVGLIEDNHAWTVALIEENHALAVSQVTEHAEEMLDVQITILYL
jgi:argininosuccinate lyase